MFNTTDTNNQKKNHEIIPRKIPFENNLYMIKFKPSHFFISISFPPPQINPQAADNDNKEEKEEEEEVQLSNKNL